MQWCAGFSGPFWQAYHDIIPKDPGYTCITLSYACHVHYMW